MSISKTCGKYYVTDILFNIQKEKKAEHILGAYKMWL